MTLRVHAEIMPQAGQEQNEILLPRSVAGQVLQERRRSRGCGYQENVPVKMSAWDTMELRRREPGFTYGVLKRRKVHVQQHGDPRDKLAASHLGSQIRWPWNYDAEVGS